MKVAVSVSAQGWDASVDERFGRAPFFAVITDQDGEEPSLENIPNTQNLQAAQGAGIQSAETVANTGAKAILTGHAGPKAYKALAAAGVEIYVGVQGTLREALDAFKAGNLQKADRADVEGHW